MKNESNIPDEDLLEDIMQKLNAEMQNISSILSIAFTGQNIFYSLQEAEKEKYYRSMENFKNFLLDYISRSSRKEIDKFIEELLKFPYYDFMVSFIETLWDFPREIIAARKLWKNFKPPYSGNRQLRKTQEKEFKKRFELWLDNQLYFYQRIIIIMKEIQEKDPIEDLVKHAADSILLWVKNNKE